MDDRASYDDFTADELEDDVCGGDEEWCEDEAAAQDHSVPNVSKELKQQALQALGFSDVEIDKPSAKSMEQAIEAAAEGAAKVLSKMEAYKLQHQMQNVGQESLKQILKSTEQPPVQGAEMLEGAAAVASAVAQVQEAVATAVKQSDLVSRLTRAVLDGASSAVLLKQLQDLLENLKPTDVPAKPTEPAPSHVPPDTWIDTLPPKPMA
jgi:hypothetical protein